MVSGMLHRDLRRGPGRGGSRRGVPAPGLADLRRERLAERGRDESSGLENAVHPYAVLVPGGVEEVDEVLGGEVAGRTRRVGAAAGAAGGAVERPNPRI